MKRHILEKQLLMEVSLNMDCPEKIIGWTLRVLGNNFAMLAFSSIAVFCAHQTYPVTADEYDYW